MFTARQSHAQRPMLTVDFELLDVRPGQLVLDAGCGGGRHSFEAFRRGSCICAMDYDLEEVKKVTYSLNGASRELRKNGGQFAPMVSDVVVLPFADASFDRIICSEVLEHIHEDTRALAEFVRVLKPGGRIAATVPTFFTEAVYGFLSPLYFANPGGHVRKFTPRELAEKMRRAGLRIYAVGHAHGFHSPYWLLRCAFGLDNEDHPVSRTYRKFLVKTIESPNLSMIEKKLMNYCCPKSLIIYGQKMV
jgi:ubiquinone/menaquinone biosynthesis C-methylase UbiE